MAGPSLFLTFPTKREAAIYLADSGRHCTRWVRELNELFRLITHAGQAWATTMDTYTLLRWARFKAAFDQRLAHLAMRSRAKTPGHVLGKVAGMAEELAAGAAIVSAINKLAYTGDAMALQMSADRALAIHAEAAAWQSGGGSPPPALERRQA